MLKQLNPFSSTATLRSSEDGKIYSSLKQLMGLRWTVQAIKLPKTKKISRPQTGSHLSKFRGRGMEFSEVRVYQPGDDVRSIDWRVTARRQTPHTKLFNEERERPLLILCDQSQSQFFGSQHSFKSVRAAEAAALFAWTALKHNDRVGGIVFSDHGHHEIKPARNRKNVMRFLNLINDFNHALSIDMPSPDTSFKIDDALTECIRLSKPGTLIVIISDFSKLSQQSDKLLSKLAKHSELLMVHTFDPLEYELPTNGIFPVSDGNETLVIDASKKTLKRDFDKLIQQRQYELKRISTRLNAPLIELSTEFPAISSIQSLLFSLQR
tara:strand:+ start:70884 stop:71855 length:972 start_codon:yes stop_codon:yes gene_type:complete